MTTKLSIAEAKRILNSRTSVVVCANTGQAQKAENLILVSAEDDAYGDEIKEVRRTSLGAPGIMGLTAGFPFSNMGRVSSQALQECLKQGGDPLPLLKAMVVNSLSRHDDEITFSGDFADNSEALTRAFEQSLKRLDGKRHLIFYRAWAGLSSFPMELREDACTALVRGMLRALLWLKAHQHQGIIGKMVVMDRQLATTKPFAPKATTFVDSSKLFADTVWLEGANPKCWGGTI